MELLSFLETTVTPYHTVETVAKYLNDAGFTELELSEPFSVKKGGSYYIRLFGTGLFAFAIGHKFTKTTPLRMAAAHTDAPCLRVKPKAEATACGCKRLNVEVYGGAILNSWYDRPLSLAGKVVYRKGKTGRLATKLFDAKRPILQIPDLAIHMNRNVNKGVETKPQKDLLPILGTFSVDEEKSGYFTRLICREAGIDAESLTDFDVTVYCDDAPCFLGADKELISSPRLDNQLSCYSLARAITEGTQKNGICAIALYDHEEVGSRSGQGADSALTAQILERIYSALGATKEEMYCAQNKGVLLSVDGAHALHPNHTEVYDRENVALLNEGVAFKINSSQRYAFHPEVLSMLRVLCAEGNISYQCVANHSDQVGGSTIGPILSSHIPMRTQDLGVPLLSMHSARELCGRADVEALTALLTAYFNDENGKGSI